MAGKVTRTEFFSSVIPEATATFAYEYLRDTIKWEEGVRSKHGFTRLAKSVDMDDDSDAGDIVSNIVKLALAGIKGGKNKLDDNTTLAIFGTYLNYYRDGSMYTPNHSHPGTTQIIISLGGKRTLNVAKKSYVMGNGDVAIFGGSVHGVPKEDTTDGRISIALFAKII